MAKRTQDAEIRMSVSGADDSRIDIQKVEKAFESLGTEGAKVEAPVVRALQNIQKAVDNYERKLADGKAVSTREVNVIVQQFARLESAVESSEMSIADFPDDVRKAMTQAEQHVKNITREFGKMDDAVKDNAANVKVAGDAWPGFGAAIEGVGGKMGTAAAKFGMVSAAFSQGLAMGQQFNAFVGTDMSEWDKAMAKVAAAFKIAFEEMADNAVATGNLIITALTPGDGYADRVKQAYGALREEFAESAKVVANFGEEIDKETAKKKANEDATKANAAAQKALADEQAKAAAEAAKHAAEQKSLEDQIAAVTLALETNIQRLKDLEAAGVDAEHGVINATSQMGYYGREVENATQAVERQRAEVDALTSAHGSQSPIVDQARAKLQQLEQQLANSEARFTSTSGAVKQFEDQQVSAEQAGTRLRQIIEQQTTKQQDLAQQYGASVAAAGQATAGTDAAAVATDRVGNAAAAAAPKVELVKDALGNVAIKSKDVETAANAASTGLDGVVGSAQKLAAAFGSEGVVAEIDSIKLAVDHLNDALIRVHDTAIEVKRKLSEMGDEGDDASTAGGGGKS